MNEIPKGHSIILCKREIATQHVRARFHELPNVEHRLRFKGFLENMNDYKISLKRINSTRNKTKLIIKIWIL